jgi:hypothetical protein
MKKLKTKLDNLTPNQVNIVITIMAVVLVTAIGIAINLMVNGVLAILN